MGINDSLFVSVLMTAYNAEKYIEDAISSILNQTYKDFEFIILNDGSTDNTLKIIQSFKDERIRIINDGKLGYYKAKIKLINEARGKYIAIMDADDICYPNRLSEQVNFLNTNPNFGLVGANAKWINNENLGFGKGFNFSFSPDELKCRLLFHNCFVHTSVLIRKSILDNYHINYKELAGEDYDMWIQISKYSEIYNIPKDLIKYRIHQGNMIHSSWYKLDDGLYNIIKEQLYYYFNSEITYRDVDLHYSLINFNKLNSINDMSHILGWISKLLVLNNNLKIYEDDKLKKVLSERATKKLMRLSENKLLLLKYLFRLFRIVGYRNIFLNISRVIYVIYLSIFRYKIKNV